MDAWASLCLKLSAALGVASAGGTVVAEVITGSEHLLLGIPQSWFLAAIVGALIGLLLLSEIDAAKVAPPRELALGLRWITLLLRVGLLGLFVLAFAMTAGWIVVAAAIYFPSIKDAGMAFSGLSGLVIKPMLPHYLSGLQKVTDRLAGRAGGTP